MGIAGKGVSDQDRVGTVSVERSGGLIADIDIFQLTAAIQRQRRFQAVIPGLDDKYILYFLLSFDFITSKV